MDHFYGIESGAALKIYEKELDLCSQYGGDVDRYRRLSFDVFQIKQIRLGLEHSVDVNKYADPKLAWYDMERIRCELETGNDLKPYMEQGFNWMQCEEIEKGLRTGVSVNTFAKIEFVAPQMREIRKGLEQKVDVSVYAKPELNRYQMRELRHGLLDKLDVLPFANPAYHHFTIKAMCLSAKNNFGDLGFFVSKGYQGRRLYETIMGMIEGADIKQYLERGFDEDQLIAINEANNANVNIKPYLGLNMYGSQLREIISGLNNNIPVAKFATGEYNWMQMREIRLGLEKKLDVEPYLNSDYTAEQMREIRIGIEYGMDVRFYAMPQFDAEEMAERRDRWRNEELKADDEIKQLLEGSGELYDIGSLAEDLLGESEDDVNPALALAKELVGGIAKEIDIKDRESKEAQKDIQIIVSEDKMNAYLVLAQPVGRDNYGVREIMRRLMDEGIKQGIMQEVIKDMILNETYFREIKIAEGKYPTAGSDGFYTYYFRQEVKAGPKILENGSVDYKNLELNETVTKDQLLAEYTQATSGDYGFNVFGEMVAPTKGNELPELTGKGFYLSEDRKQYMSSMDGIIEWFPEGKMEIRNVYDVVGGVNNESGNIKFDGDVNVLGDVAEGFSVIATGNIVIDGDVEASDIEAGGDVLIRKGCQGKSKGTITAGGTITGQFFESVTMKAKGDILCTYLLNCQTNTESMLKVAGRRGVIIGGYAKANLGIECFGIGNVAGARTSVEVGIDAEERTAYSNVMDRCDKLEKDIKTLEEGIEKIIAMEQKDEKVNMFYEKLTDALYTQKIEQKEALEEREERIIRMTKLRSAKVRVTGKVYIGVKIYINTEPYTVTSELKDVVFMKQEGKTTFVNGA